jgi:hypothetical protein
MDIKSFAVPLTEDSNNNSNIASSSKSQSLKRSHDEQKAEEQKVEKQEGNKTKLEDHDTPDKKRRIFSQKGLSSLDSDLIMEQKDDLSLELDINNDTAFSGSINNDNTCNISNNEDPLSEMIAETKRLVEAVSKRFYQFIN